VAILIFAIAVALDEPLSKWVHNSGLSPAMKNATGAAHYFIHYGLRFYGQLGFCVAMCLILWLQRRIPIAFIVLLGGQDGWPGSSTALDQVGLWRRGGSIAVPMTPESARGRARGTTVLEP